MLYLCTIMKSILFYISLFSLSLPIAAQTIAFENNDLAVVEIAPEAATGLHHIYVLHSTDGVSMTYTARSAASEVTWQDFGEQGGAYATPTAGVTTTGRVSRLNQVIPNRGYIITEGTTPTYVWVTDYSTFGFELNGITALDADDCGTATLTVDGSAPPIIYYSINGARRVLDREFSLTYNTLEWNDSTGWQQIEVVENLESLTSPLGVPAPLCNTTFTLTGDKFRARWSEPISVESDTYVTMAVDVRATAVQEERDNDNEKSLTDGAEGLLGGSAPVHIVFTGHPTDAVVYREWQMSQDPNFDNIEVRLNQNEVDYVFNNAGTFYWRYIGANESGECEATAEPFTVNVGVSELLCPNAFSPGSSEGTNDIWKVTYSSIIDFHCWIFNRWGNQVFEFTDPSQGWDGTYHGKVVGSGVYYYVITATGSDGKKYKLSGDINVIRAKKSPYGGTTTPDDGTGETDGGTTVDDTTGQ